MNGIIESIDGMDIADVLRDQGHRWYPYHRVPGCRQCSVCESAWAKAGVADRGSGLCVHQKELRWDGMLSADDNQGETASGLMLDACAGRTWRKSVRVWDIAGSIQLADAVAYVDDRGMGRTTRTHTSFTQFRLDGGGLSPWEVKALDVNIRIMAAEASNSVEREIVVKFWVRFVHQVKGSRGLKELEGEFQGYRRYRWTKERNAVEEVKVYGEFCAKAMEVLDSHYVGGLVITEAAQGRRDSGVGEGAPRPTGVWDTVSQRVALTSYVQRGLRFDQVLKERRKEEADDARAMIERYINDGVL